MSIRSIDLQVLIPRATEASRTQQLNDQQAALQQQQHAAQWQQLSTVRQQQVQRTPQSAGAKVDADAKREGRNHSEKRQEDARTAADEGDGLDGGLDPLRGHHIDIKT